MSERYINLFSLDENLYFEDAPVIISAGKLLKDTQTGNVLVQLKIKNISAKIIKAARVSIHALNIVGKPLEGDTEKEYLDLAVGRGEGFGQKVAILLPNTSTRGFKAEVTQVAFADNSIWEGVEDAVWEPLPKKESANTFLHDPELVKQFRLKYGESSEIIPKEYKDLWLCVCGTWNNEAKCNNCNKEKVDILPLNLDELESDKNTRLEQEKITREKKNEKKKETRKRVGIALIALALAYGAFFVVTHLIIPEREKNKAYKEALHLAEVGEYDLAINALQQLGNYKDCNNRIMEVQNEKMENSYQTAFMYYQEGQYELASELLKAIPDYRDSAVLSKKCDCLTALKTASELIEKEDYQNALNFLGVANDFSITELDGQIDYYYYDLAQKAFNQNNYDIACSAIEKIKTTSIIEAGFQERLKTESAYQELIHSYILDDESIDRAEELFSIIPEDYKDVSVYRQTFDFYKPYVGIYSYRDYQTSLRICYVKFADKWTATIGQVGDACFFEYPHLTNSKSSGTIYSYTIISNDKINLLWDEHNLYWINGIQHNENLHHDVVLLREKQ